MVVSTLKCENVPIKTHWALFFFFFPLKAVGNSLPYFPPCLSVLFLLPALPRFSFSCLSLTLPVCLSLPLTFYPIIFCQSSLVPPLPFHFFIFFSISSSSPWQGQRRAWNWPPSRPSPCTCWPVTEPSCRWTSRWQCPCPCRLTVAWRRMTTSPPGDLTLVWVGTHKFSSYKHLLHISGSPQATKL